MLILAAKVSDSLNLMWKGMLAIFIAIGIIWLAVFVMGKIDGRIKRRKLERQKTEEHSSSDTPQK